MRILPQGYDPITLYHYLWYKCQCHEAPSDDFQRLFENIIKRSKPEFMAIRPYGRIGDRKCDGLFFVEGTVFQVYSPDELKQSELESKINDDLDGAVAHWGEDLRMWVFVYNVRRGLSPDVPSILRKKAKQHPTIQLDHMSNDKLWEIARGLSLQQRVEILGAPAGYEHLFFLPVCLPEDICEAMEHGWIVLIQDVLSPICVRSCIEALIPERIVAPIFIRPAINDLPWEQAAEYQSFVVRDALAKTRDLIPRFAVFSLAPIPLAIQLGFLLSDRIQVRCFQFDRDQASWCWPEEPSEADCNLHVTGLPEDVVAMEVDVVLRLSLSDTIAPADTQAIAPANAIEVDIYAKSPSVCWLRSREQLVQLGKVTRNVLAALRSKVPTCRRLHLFYAGPTGGAVVVGQQINPRMNPQVELYEYSRQTSPRYRLALTLKDDPYEGCEGLAVSR